MTGHTHRMFGIASAGAFALCFSHAQKITDLIPYGIFVTTAGIGAFLPDIDQKQSTISKQHKAVSFFARLFTTHRGFTHSPFALILLGAALFIACKVWFPIGTPYALSIILGYASHIFLDFFNPKGIPLLYPIKKDKFHALGFKTGGVGDSVIFGASFVAFIFITCFYAGKIPQVLSLVSLVLRWLPFGNN